MSRVLYKKLAIVSCFMVFNVFAFAHGGEDHSEDKTKTGNSTSTYFSTENSSAIYEVLLKYGELNKNDDAHITLYLSNVNTNKPISGAKLQIVNTADKEQKITIIEKDSGIYELETKFSDEKSHSFNITINAGLGADLIQLSHIEVGKKLYIAHEELTKSSHPFFSLANIITIIVTLMVGLIIGLFLKRPAVSGKALSILLCLVLTSSPLSNFRVMAHGDEDHGVSKEGNSTGSTQILVPKETQFLFDITTEKLQVGNFAASINLFGTVLPTSSGKALVQTPQTGVIRSLNVTVGQNVVKGQLLAVVEQNIDAGTQLSWLTQKNTLEAEVIAAKKEYDRLKSIEDIAAKRDVEEAERRYTTAVNNLKLFQKSGGGSNRLIILFSPLLISVNYMWKPRFLIRMPMP